MLRTTMIAVGLLLGMMMLVAGCDRGKRDKIDEIPRGTGGTPATQTTRPGA